MSLRNLSLLGLCFAVHFACGSGTTAGAGNTNQPDGAHDQADGLLADGKQETGFITWTYNGQPVGMYVPAPTGKPLPIVMFLHGCTDDPIYPSFWMIEALKSAQNTQVSTTCRPSKRRARTRRSSSGSSPNVATRVDRLPMRISYRGIRAAIDRASGS